MRTEERLERCSVTGFEASGKGAVSHGRGAPLEAGKSKETDFRLEFPRKKVTLSVS